MGVDLFLDCPFAKIEYGLPNRKQGESWRSRRPHRAPMKSKVKNLFDEEGEVFRAGA
jgi:hypothetical protein